MQSKLRVSLKNLQNEGNAVILHYRVT